MFGCIDFWKQRFVVQLLCVTIFGLVFSTAVFGNWLLPAPARAVPAAPVAKPVTSFELSPLELTKKKIVQASNNSLKELIFENFGDALKHLNNLDRESAELGLLIADVQDFCTDRIEAALKDSRTALNLLRCRDHELLQACATSLIDLDAQVTALTQELKRQRAALNTQFTQLKKSVDSDKLKPSSTN
ncbi:MAG TPA: hypothetical protein VJJ83_00385 [Candidatus Babeliales bacterium]|nr:hypothetical protein [Candidatus Babeliales bacterium]